MAGSNPEVNRLHIGWAERVITPPLGVELSGFAARKGVAEGVHDDLHARALVVQGSDTAIAVLAASVLFVDQELVDGIREEVARSTGLPGDHILVAATHTHSGPKSGGEYDASFKEECVRCLVEAWERRAPGRIGAGVTTVEDVGRNRRRLDYGGLPVDPEVGILKTEDLEGNLTGLLINYACHPTTMGPHNLQITEDWPCYSIRRIREQVGEGVVVAYVNGAEGDINPGYGSGLSAIGAPIPIRTFAFAEKIGTRLGLAVLEALPAIATDSVVAVRTVSRRVDLPCRTTFPVSLATAESRKTATEQFLEKLPEDAPLIQQHQAEIDVFFAGMLLNCAKRFYGDEWEPAVSVELQSIQLGDTALTSFPGEVFSQIGVAAKQQSPFAKTFVVGVANGASGGYLPTADTYEEGDYEVVAAKYARNAGDVLIEETVEQLRRLE
jgi:neutral ceramidase